MSSMNSTFLIFRVKENISLDKICVTLTFQGFPSLQNFIIRIWKVREYRRLRKVLNKDNLVYEYQIRKKKTGVKFHKISYQCTEATEFATQGVLKRVVSQIIVRIYLLILYTIINTKS